MDRDTELFKASFYADLTGIKRLVKTKKDLQISIPVTEGDYALYWDDDSVSISILDILNWAAYGFYEYIEREKLCCRRYDANGVQVLNDCINPSKYYQRVVACIEWVCRKFLINNYHIMDYSYYSVLRAFLFRDQDYLSDDEMAEARQRGFCQIDLDLINVALKGNGKVCYELIKKGANYKTDPIDYTDESLIVSVLGADNSLNMLGMISYLCHEERFATYEPYKMLSSLYQVGVNNYILDIVTLDV